MMTRRTQYDWEAELKEAFRIFDMDGNGSVKAATSGLLVVKGVPTCRTKTKLKQLYPPSSIAKNCLELNRMQVLVLHVDATYFDLL